MGGEELRKRQGMLWNLNVKSSKGLKNISHTWKTILQEWKPPCLIATIISKSLLLKMNVGNTIYFYVKQSLSSLHDRAPWLQEVKNILNGKVHIKLPNGKIKQKIRWRIYTRFSIKHHLCTKGYLITPMGFRRHSCFALLSLREDTR